MRSLTHGSNRWPYHSLSYRLVVATTCTVCMGTHPSWTLLRPYRASYEESTSVQTGSQYRGYPYWRACSRYWVDEAKEADEDQFEYANSRILGRVVIAYPVYWVINVPVSMYVAVRSATVYGARSRNHELVVRFADIVNSGSRVDWQTVRSRCDGHCLWICYNRTIGGNIPGSDLVE